MAYFRKRPVVIQAFQMIRARRLPNADWPEWANRAWNLERGISGSLFTTVKDSNASTLSISTLEGRHEVSWNDWIIQGVQGELYPCKPDIFEATYENVRCPDGAHKWMGWDVGEDDLCDNCGICASEDSTD